MIAASDLLDQAEVAALLGVQPSSLRAMLAQPDRHRRIDGMPSPIRRVGNAPVWDRRQVEGWLAGDGAPLAVAVWEDTANRSVFLCFDHASRDAAVETFAASWPSDGPFGQVLQTIELAGPNRVQRCDHPAHSAGAPD